MVLDSRAESGSDNPIPPRARGELESIALRATSARGQGRKALRFPALRRVYSRGRINPATGEWRGGASYGGDVWRYVVTWGFRILNDAHVTGHAMPTAADLAALFAERIHERAVVWHSCDGRGGAHAGLSYDAADKLAEDAAVHVLRDWSPSWLDAQRERGRRGGQRSRRGPTWTLADLDALAALDGLTVDEQAARLGKSPASIKRMRHALRDRDA